MLEVDHVRVDFVDPSRSLWEADPVAGHRVPAADRFQLAVVVVAGPILQHRRVVNERVQIPANSSRTYTAVDRLGESFALLLL